MRAAVRLSSGFESSLRRLVRTHTRSRRDWSEVRARMDGRRSVRRSAYSTTMGNMNTGTALGLEVLRRSRARSASIAVMAVALALGAGLVLGATRHPYVMVQAIWKNLESSGVSGPRSYRWFPFSVTPRRGLDAEGFERSTVLGGSGVEVFGRYVPVQLQLLPLAANGTIAFAALFVGFAMFQSVVVWSRFRRGCCVRCGYQVAPLEGHSTTCPECGGPILT